MKARPLRYPSYYARRSKRIWRGLFATTLVAAWLLGLGTPARARGAEVAVVWHIAPPRSSSARAQASEVSDEAPDAIGDLVAEMSAHAGAQVVVAADRSYLDALRRAASGDTLLGQLASGRSNSLATADVLELSERAPAPSAAASRSNAARRYRSLVAGARLALAGQMRIRFSRRDLVDVLGYAAMFRLAREGDIPASSALLPKQSLDAKDLKTLADLSVRADRRVYARLGGLVKRGAVEMVAVPTWEPILPLLIDSAGKSDVEPNAVRVGASADAAKLIADGMQAAAELTGARVGIYSPFGAYDDATAALMQQQRAAYGLFSDRVLAGQSGGSAQAAQASAAAAYRAYSLQTGRTAKLAALFWNEADSAELNALPPSLPAGALGSRLRELVDIARASPAGAAVNLEIVRLDALGAWEQRADDAQVIRHLVQALSPSGMRSTTLTAYLARHGTSAAAYGFSPAASQGSFDLWMGSAAQARLWSALVTARSAAGSDAAMEREGTTGSLAQAEAARWYELPILPEEHQADERGFARFRELLSGVYRSARKMAPRELLSLSEPTLTKAH
ncbi:MAG: hypothetical protein GIW99_01405 [Candidatus Eremiobacteraeota bacterium]|nr:hypothetical protein [Candidatus Eremiobacteraeota bacterium]MBC5826342.1 hypothetical protein [Candidatus Eremiobacteraeota bacterium]